MQGARRSSRINASILSEYYNFPFTTLNFQVTNGTIGSTVQTLAMQAEESAINPDQQTNEMLSMFDNILSSVADFVSGPNASVIDDVVSKN